MYTFVGLLINISYYSDIFMLSVFACPNSEVQGSAEFAAFDLLFFIIDCVPFEHYFSWWWATDLLGIKSEYYLLFWFSKLYAERWLSLVVIHASFAFFNRLLKGGGSMFDYTYLFFYLFKCVLCKFFFLNLYCSIAGKGYPSVKTGWWDQVYIAEWRWYVIINQLPHWPRARKRVCWA